MAKIEDYTSGKVVEDIKMAFEIMDGTPTQMAGTKTGDAMLKAVRELNPKKIRLDQAIEYVSEATQYAVGERVCLRLHPDAPLTKSVFLNKLAQAMASKGLAKLVSREEAIENLKQYRKNSLIISKVSGEPAEICPTWPKRCLYWNMEKHGLKCIQRT